MQQMRHALEKSCTKELQRVVDNTEDGRRDRHEEPEKQQGKGELPDEAPSSQRSHAAGQENRDQELAEGGAIAIAKIEGNDSEGDGDREHEAADGRASGQGLSLFPGAPCEV